MKGLSKGQLQIINYILDYEKRHNLQPHNIDISRALGISPAQVAYYKNVIIAKGYAVKTGERNLKFKMEEV